MKKILIPALALTIGLTAGLPALALTKAPGLPLTGAEAAAPTLDLAIWGGGTAGSGEDMIILVRRGRGGDDGPGDDRGGRGRGRGGDDGVSTDDNGGTRTSGRRKPRIKGGSGCDDPGDVLEHPECR